MVVKINLKKKKWLLICCYNPHKSMIDNHLYNLGKHLNELCKIYDNLILMGDYNSEMSEDAMNEICCVYSLSSLVSKPTCSKNPNNPICIDLILTNKRSYFQNTTLIETGLSDFHKLMLTAMKCSFQKQLPKVIYYRNYKYFDNDAFVCNNLSTFGFRNISCEEFENLFMCILNEHAPIKKKYIGVNIAHFMNKELCKVIMTRSRLRNIFLKLKTNESRGAYKIQRNYCVKLQRKTKCCYYENLNFKLIQDNKKKTFIFSKRFY